MVLCLSCSKDDSIVNKPPCPPINIVPTPAYNSPVWHPNGAIIGFNHTPLKEIQYPYGEHCQGRQIWEYDSTGFWLIDTDGSNLRRTLPFQLQTPSWSPDGNWIAFVSSDQICKMRFTGTVFDTTTITQLTFEGRNYFPTWSPDSNWLAYDSNYKDPSGNYIIWKMKNDGSEKTKISEYGIGAIRTPHWSPDGKRIVHSRYFDNNKEITLMSSNGEGIKRLTRNTSYDSNPKYLSTEDKIIFSSYQDAPPTNLFIMDTTGNNIKQITSEGIDRDFGIPFSPSSDGKHIVYTRYDSKDWSYENGTIWILDIVSSAKTQLTFNEPPNE